MLAGVVVSTRLGIQATIFYLAGYVLMNMAAFAVITARERETAAGDDISSLYGLGADRPLLAWPMTIAMLSLAGFPATVGFFGKLYLIQAAVDNEYAWLGVVIVIGSAISLVYYLRVIAAVWMRPASDAAAGGRRPRAGRPAGDGRRLARGRRRGRRGAVPARRDGDAVDGVRRRGRAAAPDRRCASPRWSSSPSSARSPRSRSGSGPSRSSTSPATRARRSPRSSSRTESRAARGARLPTGGGEFPRARLQGACHLPLPAPPPARPRSSTSGCWPSWPPRSRWPRRRRGWRGCRREVAGVVRTGVCIVGGDVCRASDAAAAGLRAVHAVGRAARRRAGGHGPVGPHRRRAPVARGAALGRSVAVTKVARDDVGVERRARLRARAAEGGRRGRGRAAGRRRGRLGVPRRGERAALPRRGALRALGRDRALAGRVALGRGGAGRLGLGRARRRRDRRGRRGARAAPARPGIEVSAEAALGARIGRGSTTLYLRAETDGPAHDRRARRRCSTPGAARAGRRGVHARPLGPARARLPGQRARRPRARGRRDRRAAGPARRRQPRGRRAAAAPPRAVAAVGRRRTCARRCARRSASAPWSAASTRSRTARARSSWPAGWAPRSASRRATRRSTGGSWRRAPGRPDRKNAPGEDCIA